VLRTFRNRHPVHFLTCRLIQLFQSSKPSAHGGSIIQRERYARCRINWPRLVFPVCSVDYGLAVYLTFSPFARFYGMVIIQAFAYFLRYPSDRVSIKILVRSVSHHQTTVSILRNHSCYVTGCCRLVCLTGRVLYHATPDTIKNKVTPDVLSTACMFRCLLLLYHVGRMSL
jgi:hypothetical protein